MIVCGKEITFHRTVLAECEIAEACPNQDISNLGKAMSSNFVNQVKIGAKVICAMSRSGELIKRREDPNYKMNPLTEEDVMLLDDDEFIEVLNAAMDAFTADGKTTVETEPVKKNEITVDEKSS